SPFRECANSSRTEIMKVSFVTQQVGNDSKIGLIDMRAVPRGRLCVVIHAKGRPYPAGVEPAVGESAAIAPLIIAGAVAAIGTQAQAGDRADPVFKARKKFIDAVEAGIGNNTAWNMLQGIQTGA